MCLRSTHLGRGDARLAAADSARKEGAGLVEPGEDLRDAAVRDPQLAADVAGPDAHLGHLDDPAAGVVGQGAAIDEVAAELVHLAVGLLAGRGGGGCRGRSCSSRRRLLLARVVQVVVVVLVLMLKHFRLMLLMDCLRLWRADQRTTTCLGLVLVVQPTYCSDDVSPDFARLYMTLGLFRCE